MDHAQGTRVNILTGQGLPPVLAQVINLHHQMFGHTRMSVQDSNNPDPGETPANEQQKGQFVDDDGTQWGFPAETATADMSDSERAEYWKHKARKHESGLNAARRENSDLQKAKDELGRRDQAEDQRDWEAALKKASDDAYARAQQEARATYGAALVRSEFVNRLTPVYGPESAAAIAEDLNTMNYLTDDGKVDTDKVIQRASQMAPKTLPDFGQGRRGDRSPTKGVQAGRDLHTQKHRKPTA